MDGLRRLKPAEQELPLMPSPPSIQLAAGSGAASEISIETASPYLATSSLAAAA